MLSLHKKAKKITYFSALAVLAVPAVIYGVSQSSVSNSTYATGENVMSEGFADQAFYDCILNAYQTEHQGETIAITGLTDEQLGDIYRVSCTADVANLSGIEKLTGTHTIEILAKTYSTSQQFPLIPNNVNNLTNLESIALRDFRGGGDVSNLGHLPQLKRINLSDSKVENLDWIDRLTSLQQVKMINSYIDDDVMSSVTNWPQSLLDLDLSNTIMSSGGSMTSDNTISNIESLRHLSNLNSLNLNRNKIENIEPLSDLNNLQTLKIRQNSIFDFTPILDKNFTTIEADGQQDTFFTNRLTVTLPKLFGQVMDDSGDNNTVAKQLYNGGHDNFLYNATLNADENNITITNMYSYASIQVCEQYNGVVCGIAHGSSLRIIFKSNLVAITAPAPVPSLAHGVPKTATDLELPATITMQLENDIAVNVPVTWNIDDSDYEPSNPEEQTFVVTGTLALPSFVTNEDNIPLQTSITVTVEAAEEASDGDTDSNTASDTATPDTGKNTITDETSGEEVNLIFPISLSLMLIIGLLVSRRRIATKK